MSESTPPPADPTSPSVTPPPPPRKKKRRWLKVLLALVVIVLLLVALAPTIISTGAVKSIVLGQVNKMLNGRVEINDWSIGWTSGVKVDGIRVFDASNAQIAQVKGFSTQLSLLKAIGGHIDLGPTIVDSPNFDAKFDADGQLNFAKLVKTSPDAPKPAAAPKSPAEPKSPAAPSKLPHVTGQFKLVNGSGTVEQGGQTLFITAIDGDATITDLNQPIDHNLAVAMKVGNGAPGKLTVKGKAGAVKNDVVDLDAANADEAVTIESIDLPGLAPFIPPSVGVNPKSGVINGQLALKVTDGKSLVVSGKINGQNINIDGKALQGDTYATKTLDVNIPPLTVTMPNGPNDVNAMAAKGDPITVTWDQGSASVAVDLPLGAVMNLAANKAPGAPGSLNYDVKVNVGQLAAMLPHLVHIQDGTTVTSGNFHQTVNLTMAPEAAKFAFTTDLTNVAGTNSGTKVQIQPISVAGGCDIGPSETKLPGVKNLTLKFSSAFANGSFAAQTLAQLNGQASGELEKVQSELGQIVDFGKLKMAGSFAMTIDTKTESSLQAALGQGAAATKAVVDKITDAPATAAGPAKLADFGFVFTLTNLNVTGLGDQPVTEPQIKATVNAGIFGTTDGKLQAVKNIAIALQTGDATSPTVDLAAVANVDLTNGVAADYNLSKLNIILTSLQRELGPLVPALRDVKPLDLGTLAVNSAGTFVQTKDAMDVEVKTLSAAESKGLFSVTQANPISVKMAGKQITPAGKLQVAADLVKLSQIVQQVTGGKAVVTVNGHQQKLTSGQLTGTVELASVDASTMSLTVDMAANKIAVDTATGPTAEQSLTFGLKVTPASDFSSIKDTSAYVKAGFATVNLTGVAIDLPVAPPGAKGPALPVPRGGKFVMDINDVGPIQSLVSAFTPPATQPSDQPIIVPRGSVHVDGDISRDGTSTVLTLNHLSTKDVRLQRGEAIFKVKDVDVALTAKADISGDTSQPLAGQFRQASVAQLTGHLGVAELTMGQPIVITNPMGSMTAAGAINVTGEIADVTSLVEFVTGKKPGDLPYSGAFAVVENISTNGTTLNVKGTLDVTNFTLMQNGQALMHEPKVAIANDVNADLTNHNAKINAVSVDMPASGALKLNITGGVNDWVKQRQIDKIVVNLSYDLQKLLPIVMPLLSPDQQAQFKDLVVTGKFDKTINVSGSYPDGMPMSQAIKLLAANGDVAVATVSWPSMGVEASNIAVPFTLKDGILRTVYANKPEGQNLPVAMTVNTGAFNIGNYTIDLTQPVPRLNIPANYTLADKIALNNVLAAKCGKYIPLFSNASSASGLVSATINECNKFPLSNLATHAGASNDGTLKLTYNVQQVQIGSPVITLLLNVMSKEEAGDSLRGDIKDATVSVANGEVTQNTSISFGQNLNRSVDFAGGVQIASLKLDNFIVSLSPTLLAQVASVKAIEKYLPPNIGIPLKGTLPSDIKFDTGGVGKMVKDAVAKGALGNLLGGGNKNDKNAPAAGNGQPATSQPAASDPIKDLTDIFGKKKKKKSN